MKKNSIEEIEEVFELLDIWVFFVVSQPSLLAYLERGFTCHLIYWSLARVGEKDGALWKGI
jgi:hypothetical protein